MFCFLFFFFFFPESMRSFKYGDLAASPYVQRRLFECLSVFLAKDKLFGVLN